MNSEQFDVAVVGAGIVGLAHAYHAARKGLKVAVIERSGMAVGASVRNFGLIWPIGQPSGVLLDRALRSRAHWLQIAQAAKLPITATGSLHLARHPSEWEVLEEFHAKSAGEGYETKLLTSSEALKLSSVARSEGLLGALWSGTELTASSPQVIRGLPCYLSEALGVRFFFDCLCVGVDSGALFTERGRLLARQIFVCSGPDLQTLFPETLKEVELCKLQMFSVAPADPGFKLGPALCSGLTLLHYDAFARCTESLPALIRRADEIYPEQRRWGIHVLVSQHDGGELILGDSHEYGRTIEPFDQEEINRHILDYLHEFAVLPPHRLTRRWHGVYAKCEAASERIADPLPGVTVVNGLGGAGMTLALGLAEEVVGARL